MSNYNKLSLELLADAFSREEAHGVVFAVFADKETIKTIRDFMGVITHQTSRHLFGATFVQMDSVPKSSIVLGVYRDGSTSAPGPEDFQKAYQNRMDSGNYRPDGEVWSRALSLT